MTSRLLAAIVKFARGCVNERKFCGLLAKETLPINAERVARKADERFLRI
jgi:hypothetical protein